MSLLGTNLFNDNVGGAVSLLQTHMNAIGTIQFDNNEATEGAAITMEDQSVVCKNKQKTELLVSASVASYTQARLRSYIGTLISTQVVIGYSVGVVGSNWLS